MFVDGSDDGGDVCRWWWMMEMLVDCGHIGGGC